MDDASPAKWHLAHTTWFFETFVLRDHVPGYQLFDERWPFLFNSYYEAEGQRHARPRRGMLSRPSLDEILAYREAVNTALLAALPDLSADAQSLVALGCHHEEQHQELLLTDILHHFSVNPLAPAVWPGAPKVPVAMPGPVGWIEGRSGMVEIGIDMDAGDFAFDCEGPRHTELLHPHALADRTVTNGEWAAFIADGGYRDPRHWLVGRLGLGAGRAHRGAALLGARRRRLDPLRARRPPPGRSRRAGHPCQLLRGRCLCQLGRRAAADRIRMGSRGARA